MTVDESESSAASSNTMLGMNPRWLAPELLQGQRATQASDVFAFGKSPLQSEGSMLAVQQLELPP